MREFSAATVIRCKPSVAFDWIADYRHVPLVLEGVSRWEPLGRAEGKGARYRVEMRTFGFPLAAELELDVWDRPRALGWRSVSGLIQQTGRWRFHPVAGGTEVALLIAYQPPAAAIGDFFAGRVEGLVRRRLQNALDRMRDRLESGDSQADIL